jgi:cobalt-zinc-cadmium efflux system outer membrane protein
MRKVRRVIAAACAAALALPAFAADLQHLTLGSALTLAMERNRDVRLAAIAIDNAKAGVTIADAPPNPTLSIQTANINPHAGIGAGSLRNKTIDTTIRIDQLIERGGKRESRREAATHQEGAARAERDDAVRQVKLAVAQAYYDLLAAQERVGVADETARLFEQTLAAAQSRRKAGDLAGADVDRVTVDALKARSDAR